MVLTEAFQFTTNYHISRAFPLKKTVKINFPTQFKLTNHFIRFRVFKGSLGDLLKMLVFQFDAMNTQ